MQVSSRWNRAVSWCNDTREGKSFKTGFVDMLPTMVAISTWGLVMGVAMVKSGLTDNMAALMTVIVYAGSAQLTSLPLIEAGAPLWLIFAAGFVVNIRFIIFAAALQPYFRRFSWVKRLILGYLTSDIVFVLFMSRYADHRKKGTRDQLWYFLGVIVPGWLSWQASSLAGIYLGNLVPQSWSLDFAAILAIVGIIVPLVKTRPMAVSILVAGAIAWVGQPLPLRLGLAAAVVGGVVSGVLAEKYKTRATGVSQ
jgi:predicted branched-subunit amino acid permease